LVYLVLERLDLLVLEQKQAFELFLRASHHLEQQLALVQVL
jgi:hypothetical protein